MIPADYRDLFSVFAETAATLTGLLFVAISLAPNQDPRTQRGVVQQVRAAAAFMALINTLAVSLFGLIPGDGIGAPATVLGVTGVLFTAAAARSIYAIRSEGRSWRSQLGLLSVLLLIFAFELEAGITLLIDPRSTSALDRTSDILIASLLIGVARSWELVGHRQTGILNSLAILSRRADPATRPPPRPSEASSTTDDALLPTRGVHQPADNDPNNHGSAARPHHSKN
jgi:hypothetical protein